MHQWLVYLHILGALGFMLAHGVSAAVIFGIRRQEEVAGIQALLNLSPTSFGVMYGSLLLLLASGIGAGFSGRHWGSLWIWLSLALLIVILVGMFFMGSRRLLPLRKAAGLPYYDRGVQEPLAPAPDEEILATAQEISPWPTTLLGVGGTAVILWLMVFKPF